MPLLPPASSHRIPSPSSDLRNPLGSASVPADPDRLPPLLITLISRACLPFRRGYPACNVHFFSRTILRTSFSRIGDRWIRRGRNAGWGFLGRQPVGLHPATVQTLALPDSERWIVLSRTEEPNVNSDRCRLPKSRSWCGWILISLLLDIVLLHSMVYAQWTTYTIADGLANNDVRSVIQSSDGAIW